MDNKDNFYSRFKPNKIVKYIFYFILFSAVAVIAFSFNITFSKTIFPRNTPDFLFWGQLQEKIGELVYNIPFAEKKLEGENENRINILLLGVGGQGHDGPYLTDTIILLSVNTKLKKAALISIPRDLYVPVPDYGWRKINQVSTLGELKNPDKGEELLGRVIDNVFDIPVHYFARVDFEAFKKIVDLAGGVEIDVENTINDYSYPVEGMEDAASYESRFQHLIIKKGLQKMDGDLALKYIRSRHSTGIEGNDFARARRQQKLLSALKGKIFSLSFLIQPQKIVETLEILKEHVRTNLEAKEIVRLAKLSKEIDTEHLIRQVLDNEKTGLLTAAFASDGAYILKPKSGDFKEISQLMQNIFEKN